MATPHIAPFSDDPDLDLEIRAVIGQSVGGASDPGEVLAATGGIRADDRAGWFSAWHGLAERTAEAAQASARAGHRVSAAGGFLRASAYFGVAVKAAGSLADSVELIPTFREQRDAWESFVANTPAAVERVDIPYEDASLPGWFFRPARGAAVAPTLVAVNGSDGSLAGLWGSTGAAALGRGYNVLLFDGPGQQSQLFERGVPFRPDWEGVLAPVFDFVAVLDGVDPARIAVYGAGQGGYWVARAIAFEHRYAAAITDPGVVDVSASWATLEPEAEHAWRFRARPYGTEDFAGTIETVRAYTLAEHACRITTPLLVTSAEGERRWPGQAERLAALASEVSTLVRFTAAEGAADPGQPLARTLTAERIFDWLDDRIN